MAQTAIIIDATISGTATNSYLTLAEVNTLIHQKPFHSLWDDIADDEEKNAALIYATRTLSALRWKGEITSQTQKQAFPRSSLYDNDNRLYADTLYPEWLTVACAELAYYIATEDRYADSGTEGFSKIKISVIELEIDTATKTGTIPDYILAMFKQWTDSGSRFNAEVRRV